MTESTGDLVARLHRRLLETAAERPEDAGPLTVGEIYQELIPYRGVRGELGVFELAAYEHALLRLLSGEAGLLHVVDDAARHEMAAELTSPNPILGIYRDYSALEVSLEGVDTAALAAADPEHSGPTEPDEPGVVPRGGSSSRLADIATAVPPPLTPPDATRVTLRRPPGTTAAGPSSDVARPSAAHHAGATPVPPASPPPASPAPAAQASSRAGVDPISDPPPPSAQCIECDQGLPRVEGLRYCPHCGADQSEVPCARCAAPLRAAWNFCIRCGAPRPTT